MRNEISRYVNSSCDAQVQFLVDLCNENSYTYNSEGTKRVTEMLLEQIEGLFAEHEVFEQSEVGNHHILRTHKACSPSTRSMYLLGHVDTVFPPDHPFQRCSFEGNWLNGPGTGDMKGGLVVIVYALRALAHLGLLDRLGLTLILNSDEEIGSVTSGSLYELEWERASLCLAAECAGAGGEVVISRNGKAGARLECYGRDCHVASVKDKKSSAILEMAHKVVALEALNRSQPGVSVNVGRIEGGLGPSTVPGQAVCLFDLRWSEEKDYEVLLRDVRQIVEDRNQSECGCEFVVLNHRPAMPATTETQDMFRSLKECADSLGMPLKAEHRLGTSDANFFGAAGVPTIDGLGPICVGDHTHEERILISSLPERTVLLALFLARSL